MIQKFDSGVVADSEGIRMAASRIIKSYDSGNSIVAVVASQGDSYAEMYRKGKEINDNPSCREMDVLLATCGEVSASLLAMAIEKKGYPAISLTGRQAGIVSDSSYGSARIKNIDAERIFRELDKRNIVVVAGGQAGNIYGDVTTLGLGGAETVAVALAASLKADICEVYLPKAGIYTADPEIVRDAVMLRDISYDEMLELSSLGDESLYNRSIELAKKYDVVVMLKSLTDDCRQTVIKEVDKVEKLLVRGVTRDNNIARVSVLGIEDRPGMAFKLFSKLSKEDISVDIIIQSASREETTKDISFTVSKDDLQKALGVINSNLDLLGAKEVIYSDKYSKVSVVGAGMVNHPGVASMMFEALFDADINIHMITTSEIKISVLVDINEAERAVNAIHHRFRMDEI